MAYMLRMLTRPLHSVIETPEFLRKARKLLSADERTALVKHVSANPRDGDVMEGTGGARKLRWALGAKGKSGGVRVITFYSGVGLPVFLLTLFGKGEKANLTKAQRNDLRGILGALAEEYKKGVRQYVKGRRKHPSRRT